MGKKRDFWRRPNKKNFIKSSKKAFSLVEALITLIIVGLALSAAAPLITKKMKSNITDDARLQILINRIEELEKKIEPEGMVRLFYDRECPDGWSPVTTGDSKSLDGYYIRLTTNKSNIGKKLDPSLPNIKGGFPGVGQQYSTSAEAIKPDEFSIIDQEEKDLGVGSKRPNDGIYGALYRMNTVNNPMTGVGVLNWFNDDVRKAERDDYFGFDAGYYNPIYGAADNPSTVDIDEAASEVRPKSVMFVACRKDK